MKRLFKFLIKTFYRNDFSRIGLLVKILKVLQNAQNFIEFEIAFVTDNHGYKHSGLKLYDSNIVNYKEGEEQDEGVFVDQEEFFPNSYRGHIFFPLKNGKYVRIPFYD